jgi:hypothetical protein
LTQEKRGLLLPIASRSAIILAVGLLSLSRPAWSQLDVFMRAVGFALTGSDDAEPKAIDRANCVFGIRNDVFRLNNVQTDRLVIQGWSRKMNFGDERWVTVSLHGDLVVYETTTEPMKDDGSEFMRLLRQEHSNEFKPQRSTHKEQELRLRTADQDRVKRAWDYVYSHGCVGKRSPF